MPLLAGSAVRTCLGDGAATFAALLAGRSGIGPVGRSDADRLSVLRGYRLPDGAGFAAGRWLTDCVREALAAAGVDPAVRRVAAVVGTGLRELAAVEAWDGRPAGLPVERLHFGAAVRAAAPAVTEVLTVSNACSAGGHALALAQDMVAAGEVDAVVVGGTDTMTGSMLAMIGRVSDRPTDALRPFDADREGVLLGDGAAAVVVVADGATDRPLARLLATGLSCDGHHETAPSAAGILRAVRDAHDRAGRGPAEVDLVVAHGTGTALNDPVEAQVLLETFGGGPTGPLVTAVKGAIGHTSGASALHSLDVAVRCLRSGQVPPVVGLRRPLPEAAGLRLVRGPAAAGPLRLAQVDSFGFGGVNAVTLLEAV